MDLELELFAELLSMRERKRREQMAGGTANSRLSLLQAMRNPAAPTYMFPDWELMAFDDFDPEGADYDYATAIRLGMQPDETGHWSSRAPTGQLLKGRTHPTFHKTIAGEEAAGYEIYRGADGRYYSRLKEQGR